MAIPIMNPLSWFMIILALHALKSLNIIATKFSCNVVHLNKQYLYLVVDLLIVKLFIVGFLYFSSLG